MLGFIILCTVVLGFTAVVCVMTYVFERAPIDPEGSGSTGHGDDWDRYHRSDQWGR